MHKEQNTADGARTPAIPAPTDGSKRHSCKVTKRKVSGAPQRYRRDCRDTSSLVKTVHKLGVSFWDYLATEFELSEPSRTTLAKSSANAAQVEQNNRPAAPNAIAGPCARSFAPVNAFRVC